MKKIAIFGNAGAGKSTLAREIAHTTGLPLHVLDKIKWKAGGVEVPHAEYLEAHARLIESDAWIIDGYGCPDSLWQRLEAADTLVHIDLPLALHGWWVTKRLVKGFFSPPEGWPDRSPLIASSLSSYRVLWPCHKYLTPKYRAFVAKSATTKRVFHLRSRGDLKQFRSVISAENEAARRNIRTRDVVMTRHE